MINRTAIQIRQTFRSGIFLLLLFIVSGPVSTTLHGQSFGEESGMAVVIPYPHDAILLPSPFIPWLIGPYAGPDYTIHRGEFQMTEDGIPCCIFEKGTGLGFTAGIKAYFPLGEKTYLSPRIAYTKHNGAFESLTEPYPFFGAKDTIEEARFRDELTTPLPTFAADFFFSYRIDSGLGLYLVGGPALEYITAADFGKTETIVAPDGVTYLSSGETEREVEIDYTAEAARVVFGARAGLSLLYPLSETFYLNPEITFSLPVTVVSDKWRMFEMQGTFGVLFGL